MQAIRLPILLGLVIAATSSCGSDESSSSPPVSDAGSDAPYNPPDPAPDVVVPEDSAKPDAAAGCSPTDWPAAGNVGIPAGTPALTVIADSTHTTGDGQVLDGVELKGRLYVDHKNVIIRRSRLVGDEYYAVYTTIDDSYLTIEDSEIVGGVLLTDHFIGRRNDIHAAEGSSKDDGWIFAASHVLLEDNFIHGLVGDTGAHLDGIQAMGGADLTIRHNWIEAVSPPIENGGVNAAIFFKPDKGTISDLTVECNMLIEKEGYYPLRITNSSGTIVVRHNRWQKGHLGAPVHVEGAVVTQWEDNQYDDGEVIPAP